MKTAALILAAGEASRYGKPKQLLEIDKQTLIQRAAHLANDSQCAPIVIVTGACHQEISQLSFPENITLIQNTQWKNGMGSSLATGVKEIHQIQEQSSQKAEAILILLADQPAITQATIAKLKNEFNPPQTSIVISKHSESSGPPSLFHIKHIPELLKLKADIGAKEIVKNNTHILASIEAPEAKWDIDHPKIWDQFINREDS